MMQMLQVREVFREGRYLGGAHPVHQGRRHGGRRHLRGGGEQQARRVRHARNPGHRHRAANIPCRTPGKSKSISC